MSNRAKILQAIKQHTSENSAINADQLSDEINVALGGKSELQAANPSPKPEDRPDGEKMPGVKTPFIKKK